MVNQLSFKKKLVVFFVFIVSLVIIGGYGYSLCSYKEKIYYISFDCSVNGLKEGSTVTYKGVEVGFVSKISIDIENIDLIQVTIKIQKNFPIYSNYNASLSYRGMSGFYTIDLNKDDSKDSIEMESGSFIRYKATNFDVVLQNIPEIVQETKVLLKKINESVTAKQLKNVNNSIEKLTYNLQEFGENLKDLSKNSGENLKIIFKNLKKNLKKFSTITKKMEEDYSKIQVEVVQKVCSVSGVFEELMEEVARKSQSRSGIWKFLS